MGPVNDCVHDGYYPLNPDDDRCAVCAATGDLRTALAASEAGAAQMRSALEWGLTNCRALTGGDERRFSDALAPGAGSELLARVRVLEEALEVLSDLPGVEHNDRQPHTGEDCALCIVRRALGRGE